MKIRSLDIPDVKVLSNIYVEDDRGSFTKTYSKAAFDVLNQDFQIREIYYSESVANVIRGMHFQVPPFDHQKLVFVINGKILDVVLDMRRGSPSYGKTVSHFLSSDNESILIPKGFAHGFKVMTDSATVVYAVTSVHSKEHDHGIRWDSIGYEWGIQNPIVSERDASLPHWSNYISPFIYG